MVRTPLTEAHVAAMRRVGQEETLSAGEKLFHTGDVQDRFVYVLEGEVAALDPVTGERYGGCDAGAGAVLRRDLLSLGRRADAGRGGGAGHALLTVEREVMLDLMSRIPEMSDIVITVFAARRRACWKAVGPA
jgi:thioredoxin reductase (NADPH)